MRKMTKENLKSAFAGESQAHMRYLIFADIAERGEEKCSKTFQSNCLYRASSCY